MNILEIERSTIEKDWHSRGFSCGMWVDYARHAWRDDLHETEELFMAIAGDLEIEIAGTCIRPRIGEEILIPAQASHRVRNIGNRTARWLSGKRTV